MSDRTIAVVSGGLRQPSSTRLLADRLAAGTLRALADRQVDATVDVVDIREHAHDVTNNLLTGFPSPRLREVVDRVVRADGLIAVSPIFAASYSGLFKSFFDALDEDALSGVPVLMGATGGTERHSLALEHAMRPLFTYLHATVVPTAVYAATSDWGSDGEGAGALTERIDRAGVEFAAAIATRGPREVPDEFAAPTPFEQLLTQQ